MPFSCYYCLQRGSIAMLGVVKWARTYPHEGVVLLFRSRFLLFSAALLALFALPALAGEIAVVDSLGRSVTVPESPERIIASGSGCLRMVVYLQAQDRVVAVDSAEKRTADLGATATSRPYSIANPQFMDMPLFGEFRGLDSPELIAGLSPQPQVILKLSPLAGPHPDVLTEKTGIPVIGLDAGNLTDKKDDFYTTLRLMGRILGKAERAEEIVSFFEDHLADLSRRTEGVPESDRPTCYIGGVSSRGAHGFTSTEPGYPPFVYTNANNAAAEPGEKGSQVAQIAKEKLLEWDPEVLFVDLGTVNAGEQANSLYQLRKDPALSSLTAVREGRIYGVLPYNSYSLNFGSVLADAYFVGKTLYPDRFADVDPAAMADEIYSFLVGEPVFHRMNEGLGGLAFSKIEVGE